MADDDWDTPEVAADETGGAAQQRSFLSKLSSNVNQQSYEAVPCHVCGDKVIFSHQLKVDNIVYHRQCFRCKVCDKILSAGNYASLQGKLYCKPHFTQTFKTKGNYSDAFGEADPKQKWQEPATPNSRNTSNDAAEQ